MVQDMIIFQDRKGSNLLDWIREKGQAVYRDIGRKTWRVPPVRFNQQKLCEQKINQIAEKGQEYPIKCPVLGQLNVTDQENSKAENIVCAAFESLSNGFLEKGGSAMFLISNFEYDNYLNKLSLSVTDNNCQQENGSPDSNITVEELSCSPSSPSALQVKLPKDVTKRGELDILILHQEAGVLLVQTKAAGYNFSNKSSDFERGSSVQTAIEKAGEQLSRDRNVMLYIMEDLGLTDMQITAVVALPNLPRSILLEEMSDEFRTRLADKYNLRLDLNFLCEEDFKPEENGCHGALEKWWNRSILPVAKGLDLQTMEQIAYRTVGLLSTVSVWSYTQPRMEVRDWNDAAWETGNRYTQVVLSPQQVELLKRDDQYLYLWGPAGSGKTLLLSLKGRQWLRNDHNVAILNTRLGSSGRTVGQVIEATINRTKGLKKKALRIDLDLKENEETLSSIICSQIQDQSFSFLLDEIAWVQETEKLLLLVKKLFPYSAIWCAGMLVECMPEGFDSGRLEVILRCPPSVQRVLRMIDNREERCDLYNLDSASAGLPTDGLPAHFIIHSEHGDPSIQPFDCATCGKLLADFLLNQLKLKGRGVKEHSANEIDFQTSDHKYIQSTSTESGSKDHMILKDQSKHSETWARSLSGSISSDSGCDVDDLNSNFTHKGSQLGRERCKPNDTEKVRGGTSKHYASTKKEKSKLNSNSVKTKTTNSSNKETISSSAFDRQKVTDGNQSNKEQSSKSAINCDGSKKSKTRARKPKPDCRSSNSGRTACPDSPTDQPHLRFSDAVLPLTVPRGWHHYNKRGYWSISREALAQEMILLGCQAFSQELYSSGVPVKVEDTMVMKAEGKDMEDYFVMCPVGAVHGLEYKLVVCVPSACDLPKYIKISQGIKFGRMEPMVTMKRTQFAEDYLKREEKQHVLGEHSQSDTGEINNPKIDKVRISTHVAEQGAPDDVLYEPLPAGHTTPTSDTGPKHLETMKVWPSTPSYTEAEIKKIKDELCRCCGTDRCACKYFKVRELAALHRLSTWDRAYVLMCASRCTSTLVLVLP